MMSEANPVPAIWLMRHGQTVWNAAGRAQGRLNSDLTSLGRAQAAMQRQLIEAEQLDPEVRFFCSPQGRARETAAIVFAGFKRPVTFDERLCEISVGQCEGLTLDEIIAKFPDLVDPDQTYHWHVKAPGGEGYAAFHDRIASFVNDLDGPAAIVAHGMVSRMMRAIILGLDWDGAAALPGGQGNVMRIVDGEARVLTL